MNRRINSEPDMLEFGARLARILGAGDIMALTGDLGAGKTTLARGIIQALCGGDIEVPSPTYTLVQTYETSTFELWHCDLYRLEKSEDVYELGLIEMLDEVVSIIEWPERMDGKFLKNALTINIQFEKEGRLLMLQGPDSWSERLENV